MNTINASWLSEFFSGERRSWIFVFKCLLAFYAAAGISMLLELQQPSTAMVTVGLVMHPQSGMVRAKGFYRAAGNVAGSLCAVMLIALFPQERTLFLLSLCLWVAICAGGAMKYRNFMSYGFVLSGYTTAIVALPAITEPTIIFDNAAMRVCEVLVGVIVSGVISDVVFPDRLGDVLRRSRKEHFDLFVSLAGEMFHGTLSRDAMERAHLRFVRSAVQIEDLRSSVIFEEPESRARSSRMQLHNLRYMAAATTFQSLYHLADRLERNGHPSTADALCELYAPIGEVLRSLPTEGADMYRLVECLGDCEARLPSLAADLRKHHGMTSAFLMEFDCGAAMIERFAAEMRDLAAIEATLRKNLPTPSTGTEAVHFKRSNDYVAPLVTVVRGFVTLGALCLFWMSSTWPSGPSAVLTASYFLGLLASSPSPVSASVNVTLGYAFGMTGAFFAEFYLLPGTDGFVMLVAATLPFILIGPYLLTRVATLPGMGTGYVMGFAGILALKNPMVYDPERFINDAIGSCLGVLACAAGFLVIPTIIGTPWLRDRQLAKLRRQVRVAASSPMRGLLYRCESANRDLLHQCVQFSEAGSADLRRLLTWGLAVHEAVRAIIELRQDAEHPDLPPPLKAQVQRAVEAVAALYDLPDERHWTGANHAVAAAVSLLSLARPRAGACCDAPLAHLLLLRAALRDDESVLADCIVPNQGLNHAT